MLTLSILSAHVSCTLVNRYDAYRREGTKLPVMHMPLQSTLLFHLDLCAIEKAWSSQ